MLVLNTTSNKTPKYILDGPLYAAVGCRP